MPDNGEKNERVEVACYQTTHTTRILTVERRRRTLMAITALGLWRGLMRAPILKSSQSNPCEYVWVLDPSWGLGGTCSKRDWIGSPFAAAMSMPAALGEKEMLGAHSKENGCG
jgi:hypothetical protein